LSEYRRVSVGSVQITAPIEKINLTFGRGRNTFNSWFRILSETQ
jgi:hypothetical protein